MPQWLLNQLQRAFRTKDARQIRVLNECWFFYRSDAEGSPEDEHPKQLEERF